MDLAQLHCVGLSNTQLVPVLSKKNAVQVPPTLLFKANFNIILTPTPWFSTRPLLLRLYNQKVLHIFLVFHACHMLNPRDQQTPGATSRSQQTVVRWRIIWVCVGCQYGNCFTFPFWMEHRILTSLQSYWKFSAPLLNTFTLLSFFILIIFYNQ
jgi:hypothetical protein